MEGLGEPILNIARFCSIECHLQGSGEQSVGWMMNAWDYAMSCPQGVPTETTILHIAARIEPSVNANGYRRHNVRVGSSIKPHWDRVPELMTAFLAEPLDSGGAEEWFRLYEEIHPFGDGNGRSGAILYNLIRGTLADPEWAPDFWHDHRRTPGFGAPIEEHSG